MRLFFFFIQISPNRLTLMHIPHIDDCSCNLTIKICPLHILDIYVVRKYRFVVIKRVFIRKIYARAQTQYTFNEYVDCRAILMCIVRIYSAAPENTL